jgi:long-chain fatty acid transport protein
MHVFTKNHGGIFGLALALTLLSPATFATNGYNLIGFGTESTLMGGADVAVARDTSALNTNPAGLTQIRGQAFDGFASGLRTFDLSHQDSLGNNKHADNKYTFLGGGGYAASLDSLPCSAGVGLFSQGGAGGIFKNINTPFGNRDEMSSLFGMAKISPGMGCRINDSWSVGASLAVTYASVRQKFFPDTSVGAAPFAGYRLDRATALKVGFRLGVQYRVNPFLTLATTYTEKIDLPLTDGELTANYSGMGLGGVKYHNASVTGLALPREVALGFALKPADTLLLSFKVDWINWADAIKSATIRATDPENPLAPAVYQIVTAGDWSNQWVFASGLAYDWNEQTTLYLGHNYGNSPIPAQNANPLLAGILDHHVTLGAARQISREWRMTGGLEYMLPVKENYSSPLFGNAEVRNEALFLHVMLSRRW